MITLLFSGAGVMGWAVWKQFPFIACAIISFFQILKLLQIHLIPSEKDIDKLDKASDFYFDYFNSMEKLWFSQDNYSETELQDKYYEIKKSEKEIDKILKEVLKSVNKRVMKTAELETRIYLKVNFNIEAQ